jgi:predicted deacylase
LSFRIQDKIIEKGEKHKGWLKVAQATSHDVKIPYIIINGENKGPTLTILSGVHSLEAAPIEANLRLGNDIEAKELSGTLIIIPVVNTEGFHARKSYENTLDHLNQNKVFPGDPEGSMTSRVAHSVFHHFVSRSDYLIDCHSADLGEDAKRGILIYETDDEELTRRMIEMASCFDCHYIGTTKISGNTGEAVKSYGIPCLMTESGTPYCIREEDIEFHTKGIKNLLRYLGMLEGKAVLGTPPINPETRRLWAESSGIWRKKVEAGQMVEEGAEMGEIADLLGETQQKIFAPINGVVSFLRIHYSVNQGDTLLWITKL